MTPGATTTVRLNGLGMAGYLWAAAVTPDYGLEMVSKKYLLRQKKVGASAGKAGKKIRITIA